jgi:hypothetical protein
MNRTEWKASAHALLEQYLQHPSARRVIQAAERGDRAQIWGGLLELVEYLSEVCQAEMEEVPGWVRHALAVGRTELQRGEVEG